ncbi:hypothetical protein [Massilia sp. S19_KUP03_FR1]|uniref:hypothetical protein n=1 Tax=Massilia sp. S19_KUP03_FR1 TaxID=3025503 RepID=UPI002FCDB964
MMAQIDIIDRHGPAPAELVRYVGMVNTALQVEAIPGAAEAPPDFLRDMQTAMAHIPSSVLAMLDGALLGVYFSTGLGSSAITDVIVNHDGQILGSVVMLDLDAFMDRTANAWATWKENTPFSSSSQLRLEVEIADGADNTRANAMQFLLLHEFGHVLTAGKQFLPIWWLPPEAMKQTGDYDFLRLGWQIDADKRIVPKLEEDFAERSGIFYYATQGLDDAAMLSAYRALQDTSFPSLYASTNAFDDFAETFATYVHSVMLGKPARVRIVSDDSVYLERESFWSSPRSGPKRAFMQALLAA